MKKIDPSDGAACSGEQRNEMGPATSYHFPLDGFAASSLGAAYCRMHYDEQGHPDDFTYLYTNESFHRLTGLPPVIGRAVTDIIPGIEISDPWLFEIYGRVVRTRTPETFEQFLVALQDWFSVEAIPAGDDCFLALFSIVSERRQRAASIQSRAHELEIIVNASPTPQAINDAAGNIVYVNQAFTDTYGYRQDDIPTLETWWPQAYPDAGYRELVRQRWDQELRLMGQDTVRSNALQFVVTTKDGHQKEVLICLSNLEATENGKTLVTLVDVTELKKTERQLLERTRQQASELRNAALLLASAEQQERTRLHHLLHDDIQPILVASRLALSSLAEDGISVSNRQLTDNAAQHISDALAGTRSLARELYPPLIHEKGLPAALESLVKWTETHLAVAITFEYLGDIPSLEEPVALTVFQCVRELLLNVAKHAQARSASVSIGASPASRLAVTVADDGCGLCPASLPDGGGLEVIRRRVGYLGGSMKIDAGIGAGTRVSFDIPLDHVAPLSPMPS